MIAAIRIDLSPPDTARPEAGWSVLVQWDRAEPGTVGEDEIRKVQE